MDPVRAFAHHPTLLAGYGALEMAAQRATRLDARTKELAVMRAAMLAGCEWCLDFGSAVAADAGISEEDLRALPGYADSARFSEVERLALDYAGAMTRTPVEVSDELVARLREHLDDAQMVELTTAIALENLRARFNWALGLGSQGFSDGAYCVRPEPA
jgi:4-carboxymuconolactone decarboxylase